MRVTQDSVVVARNLPTVYFIIEIVCPGTLLLFELCISLVSERQQASVSRQCARAVIWVNDLISKFQFTRPPAQKRMGDQITTGAEVSTFEQRREALKQNVRKPKLSRGTKWRIY